MKNKTDTIEKNYKEFIKTINLYLRHNKDLNVKGIMFLLRKLIRPL